MERPVPHREWRECLKVIEGTKVAKSTRGPFIVLGLFAIILGFGFFSFEFFLDLSSHYVPPRFVKRPCNDTVDHASRPTTKDTTASVRTNETCSQSCKCKEEACSPEVKVIIEEKIVERVVNVNSGPILDQWWAVGKPWHTPRMFPLCSMDACFNFTRCENMDELLVYPYDIPVPPVRYFEGINSSRWYTPDPDKACLFLVFQDLNSPWRPHPNSLRHWNHGLNHVLITFADVWHQYNPPQETIENASVLSTSLYETTFRPGFDIGIPLPGRVHVPHLQSLKPNERKYFLSFRGLRYLGSTLRSDASFRNMHNGKDVIVVTSCSHPTNDIRRKENPEFGEGCDEDQKLYNQYDFEDLMNSTFCLAPAGRSSSSYRFIEILSAGSIPVLVADNHVKPFENIILWPRCALQFPTSQLDRIVPALRGMSGEEIEERQKYCLWVYTEFLKDDPTLLRSVMRALRVRFNGIFADLAEVSSIYASNRRRLQS